MPVEQMNTFSQILTTLNFQQEKMPFGEKAQSADALPAAQDSIELSIQAKKALDALQPQVLQAERGGGEQPAVLTDAQGNRVTISAEGNSLASDQAGKVAWETKQANEAENPRNMLASATLDSGAKVSIYTVDFAEGEEKTFFDAPDKKVMAEISRADGSTETLAIRANTVISEDAEGNLLVNSGPEKYKSSERFELRGTAGNDVIINLNGATNIDCGDGNDTVISFNNMESINLGEGDNTLISLNNREIKEAVAGNGNNNFSGSINKISVGDGDNSFTGNIDEIEAGNGDNTISVNKAVDIRIGDGNNRINVSVENDRFNRSNLALGNGNNNITFSGQYNFINKLQLGDGNNNLDIGGLVMEAKFGNGNNSVSIGKGFDFSTTDSFTGAIRDFPVLAGLISMNDATMTFGNGDNSLDFAVSYGNIQLGDGNNKFATTTSIMSSSLAFGNGDNEFNSKLLTMNNLNFGNGNNTITTERSYISHILFGNGNNSMTADESYLTQINTGDGDNFFKFGNMEGCLLYTGAGDDTVYVTGNITGGISMQTFINLGAGDDAFQVDGSVKGLVFYGGDGNDTVVIKGNVLDSQISTAGMGASAEPYFDRLTIYKNIFNSLLSTQGELNEINIYGEMIESTLNNEKYKNNMPKAAQEELRRQAEQELAEQRANSFKWLV